MTPVIVCIQAATFTVKKSLIENWNIHKDQANVCILAAIFAVKYARLNKYNKNAPNTIDYRKHLLSVCTQGAAVATKISLTLHIYYSYSQTQNESQKAKYQNKKGDKKG